MLPDMARMGFCRCDKSWGEYPGLCRWALDAITCTLMRGRQRQGYLTYRQKRSQCDQRGRNWSGVATNQGIQQPAKPGRGKKWIAPLWRKHCPASTLIFTQRYWFQLSGLQDRECINFSCLMPPSLWSFITATTSTHFGPGKWDAVEYIAKNVEMALDWVMDRSWKNFDTHHRKSLHYLKTVCW